MTPLCNQQVREDHKEPIHGILAVCTAVSAALLLFVSGCGRDMEPLTSASARGPSQAAVPEDALVIDLSAATDVKPPFALKQDAEAAKGIKLVLPEGAGSAQHKGSASLKLEVKEPGDYFLWARVYWNDSCGNSVLLRIINTGASLVTEDSLYGTWHWVKAGRVALSPGEHAVVLLEREDGIALDQLLLTRDPNFLPLGPVVAVGRGAGVRRFSDDFARSAGHGVGAWEFPSGKWRIASSFDPNRMPFQYSLVGVAQEHEAVALLKEPPWNGCRISFSLLPQEDGGSGVLFRGDGVGQEPLRVRFNLKDRDAQLHLSGAGVNVARPLGTAVRLNQWHRIVVERWAWVVRVMVDDRPVLECFDAMPGVAKIGFFVNSGAAVFDDVAVEQIPWQADDGRDFRLPWHVGRNARWYRPKEPDAAEALIGRSGTVTATQWGDMPIRELILEELPEQSGKCEVRAAGLTLSKNERSLRVFREASAAGASAVELAPANDEVAIRRVAIRYGRRRPECFCIGPYHFTKSKIEDPSDYLDFTSEEYRKMAQSAEVDKLRRQRKFMPVLGSGPGDYSPWAVRQGRWRLHSGALRGTGPDAVLRHTHEFTGEVECRLRFRMCKPASVFHVEFYGGVDPGSVVEVATTKDTSRAARKNALHLRLDTDRDWHELTVSATRETLSARVDKQPLQKAAITTGEGAQMFLKVPAGSVDYDDIEFKVRRHGDDGFYYAFDRRETDWWRTGGQWIDHGGVTCVLASSWVSLIAPQGEGMLWNKRSLGPDILITFKVDANTEWFGWSKDPSHVHYPFDNIRIALSPSQDINRGYRLEVNSLDRTATVLYRGGREVKRVPQDSSFPIQYCGGHAPYAPRKNRIALVKRGAVLRAVVNGKEVLRFEDPDPLKVSRVGIGGYNTHINFSHIEVRPLPGPSRTQKEAG